MFGFVAAVVDLSKGPVGTWVATGRNARGEKGATDRRGAGFERFTHMSSSSSFAVDADLEPPGRNAACSSSRVEKISVDGVGMAVALTSESHQGVIAEL